VADTERLTAPASRESALAEMAAEEIADATIKAAIPA
jgi:hypothetical protein